MVISPMIEQQQLGINNLSLNLTRYQKIVAATLLYTIPGARYKKKSMIRAGRWLFEIYYPKTFKNLSLKCKSKHLCCGFQNNIIKNLVSWTTKFYTVEACENMFHWTTLRKELFCISQVCWGETDKANGVLFMLSSA